jgi:hypothetical protein
LSSFIEFLPYDNTANIIPNVAIFNNRVIKITNTNILVYIGVPRSVPPLLSKTFATILSTEYISLNKNANVKKLSINKTMYSINIIAVFLFPNTKIYNIITTK